MEDALRRYIERALELADQRQDELDEQDLAEIARDLGLTDDDLARVEQAITDHVDRGQGYADHGMWDDAIRELEEAAAIAPSRADIRLTLAEALTQRWAATDFPDDKRRAEELARAVIDHDPNNKPAYSLLARLNPSTAPPPPKTASSQPAAAKPRLLLLITAIGALMAMSGGVLMIVLIRGEVEPETTTSHVPPPKEEVVAHDSGESDLPLEFVAADNLAFTTLRSRLAKYPEKAFYTLWGQFEVTGDAEFDEIEIAVKLMDADGKRVLKHHMHSAWASHEATLRRGDRGVFTVLVETPRDAASVVVEVVQAESSPAKGPYAQPKEIEPRAAVEIPEHLKLRVRERKASFSPMMKGPNGFFEASWEFENVGGVPIRELTYTVDIYGKDGEQLAKKKKIATYGSHPPIGPGEVFLESTIEMLDEPHSRYEITIIELE